jgi:hypothetical protein
MGGAHNLVVLPALPVAVLPGAVLLGDDPEAIGKSIDIFSEEREAVEKLAHGKTLPDDRGAFVLLRPATLIGSAKFGSKETSDTAH